MSTSTIAHCAGNEPGHNRAIPGPESEALLLAKQLRLRSPETAKHPIRQLDVSAMRFRFSNREPLR